MKRVISLLLTLAFVLSLSVVSGVISASAVSYDYYAYTQFPGFTSFTEAEMDKFMSAKDLSNGHKDTSIGPANTVTWDITKISNQWNVIHINPYYPVNIEPGNHQQDGDITDWAAYDIPGGKGLFGDSTLAGYDGISFFVGLNGEPYHGGVRITLHQLPCKGPYFNGNTDGNDDEYSEYIGSQPIGFRYDSREFQTDEDGYVHYVFKTDFKCTDWWTKDEDGVNRNIYGDADGDGVKNGDDYYWPMPKRDIALANSFNIVIAAGPQVGDTISFGDIRGFKDSRVHFDELEEYLDTIDAINPEAYTEESYTSLMDVYLEAYDMYIDPDRASGKYSQDNIDDIVNALKKGIANLLPMFKTKDTSVNISGFEGLTEDDLDSINDGGVSYDAAMISEDVIPSPEVKQSIYVIGGAFDGPPSYDWSCFSTAAYDEDENVVPVGNVFEGDDMSETVGIRFWFKYGDNFTDKNSAVIVGLGSSEENVYFESDETVVQLPEGEDGYIGVAWDAFYDIEGEADIYDYISSLDYFSLKISGCAQTDYYIADLHTFKWSLQSADFTNMDEAIVSATNYLKGLDKELYAVLSWQHVEEAIAAAQALHNTYGVTQEQADAAAEEINACIRRLCLIGDTATEKQMDAFKAAYYSALTYWRGNYVSSTYANLRVAIQEAEPFVNDVIKADFCVELTNKLNAAIKELAPITYSGLVKSILTPEGMSDRQLAKATGQRSEDTTVSLDKTFAKLPSGYAKAIKMTADTDRTIDDRLPGGKMWDIGALNFKLMQGTGAYPIINDIENPKIPGDMIGATMGDLTGTSGLRFWFGINDPSLFEDCCIRFGVSNCTESPVFEFLTCDIPFPSTGCGWIYVPWEYFEFYDDSWSDPIINLKELRFWIFKINGTVKQGGSVYITGLSAYTDAIRGSNENPVISNVTEGQTIDVSAAGGKFVPAWSIGAAVLNGKYYEYGTPITENGDYTLTVTNADKQKTVNFTITGGTDIVYETPIVLGVEEGGEYEESVTITWDVGTATLDGGNFTSGGKVIEEGAHTLVVTNGDKVVTINFTIKAAVVPPTTKLGDFDNDGEITVADALAALRIAAKLVAEDEDNIAVGDVDKDGHVTVADALAILRVAAKLTDTL